MKKIIALCLAALLTLSLAACSGGGDIVHEARDYTSSTTSSKVKPLATSTNANPVISEDTENTDGNSGKRTYWDDEPLLLFGIDKVSVPKDLKFFSTDSSSDTMSITWSTKKQSECATQLATSIFNCLTEKGISIYEYKDFAKGELINSIDEAASILTDTNALYEIIYRYNDTDYYAKIAGLPGSGSQKNKKFVNLMIYRYIELPPEPESNA